MILYNWPTSPKLLQVRTGNFWFVAAVIFVHRVPFLSPNQQHQSTEGINTGTIYLNS